MDLANIQLFKEDTQLEQQIAKKISILSSALNEIDNTTNRTAIPELIHILQQNELSLSDDSVLAQIKDEDCWEIMDFNANQIYRNQRCFELSDYSQADYERYSPFELFERPAFVFEVLIEAMGKLKLQNNALELSYIPDYIMQEMLSANKQQFNIRHKFACNIIDNSNQQKIAFISIFHVRKIEESNISVLSSKLGRRA